MANEAELAALRKGARWCQEVPEVPRGARGARGARRCQRCQEVPGGAIGARGARRCQGCQEVPEVPEVPGGDWVAGPGGTDGPGKNVVITVEPVASDTAVAAVVPPASAEAAGPVAALNSGQQVQRKYFFNPEKYSDAYTDSGSFWAVRLSEQRVESSVRVSCSCEEASICCPRWRKWRKPWPKSCSGFHAGGSQKTGSPGGGHSS